MLVWSQQQLRCRAVPLCEFNCLILAVFRIYLFNSVIFDHMEWPKAWCHLDDEVCAWRIFTCCEFKL